MTARKPLRWYDLSHGYQVPGCDACEDFISQPGMAEAIATVGIETGGVNVRRMVEQYHANRHQEAL